MYTANRVRRFSRWPFSGVGWGRGQHFVCVVTAAAFVQSGAQKTCANAVAGGCAGWGLGSVGPGDVGLMDSVYVK